MKKFCRTGARRWAGLLLSVLVIGACAESTGVVDVDGVRLQTDGSRIQLTNNTDSPVFFYVVGMKSAPLYDPYLCLDASRCTPLEPGVTQSIPYPTFNGERETEAILTWWHSVVGPDGQLRADSFRTRRFPLPLF